MDPMFRLDFSRGTVEKIDSSIPPRGWQATAANPNRDTPPQSPGYRFGDPETAPPAKQDE